MKFKRLTSISNSICEKAISGSVCSSLECFAEFKKGYLKIELLSGEFVDSNGIKTTIPIVQTISTWFINQLEKDRINADELTESQLFITYDTTSVATARDKLLLFTMSCESKLGTKDRVLSSKSSTQHWHNRQYA